MGVVVAWLLFAVLHFCANRERLDVEEWRGKIVCVLTVILAQGPC